MNLGLSIAKTLIEMQVGSIIVGSAEGEGSVFLIRLPFIAPQYKPEIRNLLSIENKIE